MRVAASLALLVAGLTLVASLPLGAADGPSAEFHDPPFPLLGEATFAGTGWATFRFTVPGDTRVSLEADMVLADATTAGGGLFLLRDSGSLMASFLVTGHGSGEQLHVELLDPVGVVHSQRAGGADGLFGLALGVTIPLAGTYVAVGLLAADGSPTDGAVRLHATGGSLVAATSGAETFMHADTDFGGEANALASTSGLARAQAVAFGNATESIDGLLYGWFGASLNPAKLRWEGPPGMVDGGRPYWDFPPGTYTFHVDWTVGVALSAVWAWGADVTLA